MLFGLKTRVGPRKHVLHWGTFAQPGEYDLTVHVRRRCGLLSNYFDHLFSYATEYVLLTYSFTYLPHKDLDFSTVQPLQNEQEIALS